MRALLVLSITAACLSAQVRFAQDNNGVTVTIDGKPFTVFHNGADVNRPYLAPIRSASGKIVTRGFPMESRPGESQDHIHHRGLWFCYDDVNGAKFWGNDPSYNDPNAGRIVVRTATPKGGDRSGSLAAVMDWKDKNGKTLVVEDREMIFYQDPKLRTMDFRIALTPAVDVTLGDTKEGAFAIRLADAFTERKGCQMVNAEGGTKMANIWGKRSNWVDYSTDLDGEKLGIAIFDHPKNPRHPTYWHARDYGLFALNPFGRKAFDETQEESKWKLPAGQKVEFRWRVVIHPGDSVSANVASMYKDYSNQ
jgi:hypothetical protein